MAFLVLAPLGMLLGIFMPLGLGAVSALTDHGEEYVAWGWAVNGFASVIGSVLTDDHRHDLRLQRGAGPGHGRLPVALAALRRLQRPVAAAAEPEAEGDAGDGDGEEATVEPPEEVAVGAGPAGAGPVGATTP